MDYNKTIYFNPSSKNNINVKNNLTIKNKNNVDKRKSDDICFNNFLNKFKDSQKYKFKNIPINHRMSYENKQFIISNLIKDNNEKAYTRDKNYYINLLNNIYMNDSHLSNKNFFKSQNMKKKIEKKKTYNFSKRNSKDNSGSKNSKKKLSCSNTIRFNDSNKKTSSNDFKNKTRKKLSNFTNEIFEKGKGLESEKILPVHKYQSSVSLAGLKNNSNNIKRKKSSINILKYSENEKINSTIREERILKNEIKKNNKITDKKSKIIIKQEEPEMEKCETKNNLSKKNISKNILNNNIKNKKKFSFCCFYCLCSKDDSSRDKND